MRKRKNIVRNFYFFSQFVLFLLGVAAAAQDTKLSTVETDHIKKYIYKKTKQGELAVYIHYPCDWTPKDKRPAIVFFFGGGWIRGNINQFKYQAEYLAGRGMIAARADYRVKSRHGTLASKCVEDGKSVIRWLRIHADTLGLDPNRIVASGGSAGGHVAACTFIVAGFESTSEDVTVSSRPNLMVLFNPVLDATAAKRVNRMGSQEIANALSPNLHLKNNIPPSIIFYGTQDSLIDQGKVYLQRAKQLGVESTLYTAVGVGHGFFNKQPWLNETLYLTDLFLSEQGYIPGKPTLSVSGNIEMIQLNPK
jgi:acetyl esterase/lipase